jgi:hypothetical protein
MPLPVAQTIDVAGARALFDALGFEEAARFVRGLSISDGQPLPCLRRGGPYAVPGRATRHGAHGAMGHRLDDETGWWLEDGLLKGPGDTVLAETIMAAMPGRPVTRLLAHPCLDDSMLVEDISQGTQVMMTLTNMRRDLREVEATMRRGVRP